MKWITDDNVTQTIMDDIFLFHHPEPEFSDLKSGIWETGSVMHYLTQKWPPMNTRGKSGVPTTIYDTNNDKLSVIFARIFQNLDYKIRQLSNKTTQMFTQLRIEEFQNRQEIKKSWSMP